MHNFEMMLSLVSSEYSASSVMFKCIAIQFFENIHISVSCRFGVDFFSFHSRS